MAKDLNQRGLENQVKGTAKEMEGQVRGDLGDATERVGDGRMARRIHLDGPGGRLERAGEVHEPRRLFG